MAADYDAPRKGDDSEDEGLKDRLPEKSQVSSEMDELEHVGDFIDTEHHDDLSEVVVIPPQSDEFTCMSCFIVKHRSQMAKKSKNGPFCIECAG